MGKKKNRDQAEEKPITGSGAEVDIRQQAAERTDGKLKCKCIVPCVWRGYRDEGDTVWIEKELMESDPFFKGHFKILEGSEGSEGSVGSEEPEGSEGTVGSEDPEGSVGSEDPEGSVGSEDPEGSEGAGQEGGQGELGLK